jgi:hypothetical protein
MSVCMYFDFDVCLLYTKLKKKNDVDAFIFK